MGTPFRGLLLLCFVGLCLADFSFLTDRSQPPDSDEHGVSHGRKGTTCKCGWSNKAAGRIVGGEVTALLEYPHMAALGKKSQGGLSIFCGSSIISEYHALTAAHCTHGEQPDLLIIVGAHDLTDPTPYTQVYDVKYVNHEDYDPVTFVHDISVLFSRYKIFFNDYVGPACLPSGPASLQGQWVKVTGWGHTQFKGSSSDVLRKVDLKVVSLAECSTLYKNPISTSKPSQFCTFTAHKDSCQGDSGGPVTWVDPETNRFTLVGVVSYGKGCATSTPGVNTDVFAYRDWIHRKIASTSRAPTKTCTKAN